MDDDVLERFDLRPVLVPLGSADSLGDVGATLLAAGYAGAVGDHPDDDADHAFVLVLTDSWGAPVRWREDVGAARFVGDSTAALLAVLGHRFGPGVRALDIGSDDDVPFEGEPRVPRLGITSMAWYTFKNVDNFGGLVAVAAGGPVVVAPLATSHIYSPVLGGEPLLEHALPETNQSILLWRTATRRGMFIRKRRARALHWWDEAFLPVDPSRGRPLLGSEWRVTALLGALRGDQEDVVAEISRAFRLDEQRAERLRILCRRPRSDEATFREVVDILDLPVELADVAEGLLHPTDLPGAAVREPQTLKQNLAEDWSEIRSTFRDAPDTDRRPSPFDWWQRLTAKRPLWYTLLTIVLVGGSIAVAVGRLAAGQGVGSIWIQIGVVVLWTWSYVAPRRRFLDDAAAAPPESAAPKAADESPDVGESDDARRS